MINMLKIIVLMIVVGQQMLFAADGGGTQSSGHHDAIENGLYYLKTSSSDAKYQFVNVRQNGSSELTKLSNATPFTIQRFSDGTIVFQAVSGRYLCPLLKDHNVTTVQAIGTWEHFTPIFMANGKLSFKTVHNTYLQANFEKGKLYQAGLANEWEQFELIKQVEPMASPFKNIFNAVGKFKVSAFEHQGSVIVYLKSKALKKYLSVRPDKSLFEGNYASDWERFYPEADAGEPNSYFLATHHGSYLSYDDTKLMAVDNRFSARPFSFQLPALGDRDAELEVPFISKYNQYGPAHALGEIKFNLPYRATGEWPTACPDTHSYLYMALINTALKQAGVVNEKHLSDGKMGRYDSWQWRVGKLFNWHRDLIAFQLGKLAAGTIKFEGDRLTINEIDYDYDGEMHMQGDAQCHFLAAFLTLSSEADKAAFQATLGDEEARRYFDRMWQCPFDPGFKFMQDVEGINRTIRNRDTY